MMEHFPSWSTMIAFDIAFVLVAVLMTIFIFYRLALLRKAGAQLGTGLLLAGIWLMAGFYSIDLATMLLLPTILGMERSMAIMRDIHLNFAWYVTFAAQVLLVVGLVAVVSRLLRQHAEMAAEILESTQAEQRFRSLFDRATEAITITDVEVGRCIEANPRAEALFGVSREDLIHTYGPENFSPKFQPDGRRSDEAAAVYGAEALAGNFPTFEWVLCSIDGVEVPCQITLSRFPDPERQLVRASIIDLTERKRADIARVALERQLAQAQKLESIGQMTGGVAHDFNNLLSVILGNLELLSDKTGDKESRELIEAAIDASTRGSALTRSMLNFARRAHLQPEEVALGDLVTNMDNWTSRIIPADIQIRKSIQDDLWFVSADSAGTESALLNLVLNACDAMPDGGLLEIAAENTVIEKGSQHRNPNELAPGQYVMLAVSDTGEGIARKVLAKVFDPFFSTKAGTENSGLGLSMVHGFMTQSGGGVRISSETGVGTTVRLFFPAIAKNGNSVTKEDETGQEPAAAARILVAEDHVDVLTVLKQTLESQGHEVIPAKSGDAAAALFGGVRPIDLLVTDVVMPGKLQGPALVKHLRGIEPDLPAILMTGYNDEAPLKGNGLRQNDQLLMKPVARKAFVSAVNVALHQRKRKQPG